MTKRYSKEFKIEAVRRVEELGEAASRVASDLGISRSTMNTWINRYRDKAGTGDPFPGSGNLSPDDEQLKKLKREVDELREENEILKKAAAYFAKNQK